MNKHLYFVKLCGNHTLFKAKEYIGLGELYFYRGFFFTIKENYDKIEAVEFLGIQSEIRQFKSWFDVIEYHVKNIDNYLNE